VPATLHSEGRVGLGTGTSERLTNHKFTGALGGRAALGLR
jgi:hypothetical protein